MAFARAIDMLRNTMDALGNPVGTVCASIPMCVGKERFQGAIFFHKIRMSPKAYVAYPPFYLVTLDIETGKPLQGRNIQPKEIGPDVPLDQRLPHHPDEKRPDPDAGNPEFEQRIRLLETFHETWWIYTRGLVRLTSAQREQVIQSIDDFDAVVMKRLLPWYDGLAGPLLGWMREVREKAKST